MSILITAEFISRTRELDCEVWGLQWESSFSGAVEMATGFVPMKRFN